MRAPVAVLLSTLFISSANAVDCPSSNLPLTCPTTETKPPSACLSASLKGSTLLRCTNGCPSSVSCSDVLLSSSPVGPKPDAVCWDEDGSNAQCTADCIQVTALNGTVFYPVGCKSSSDGGAATTSSETATTTRTSKIINPGGPVVLSTRTDGASATDSGIASTATSAATSTSASSTSSLTSSATATETKNAARGKLEATMGLMSAPGVLLWMWIDFFWF